MIAALTVSPKRRRVGLYFSLLPNKNVNGEEVTRFLRHLARHLKGNLLIVWDRLGCHRARVVKAFLRKHQRIHTEHFPPYAPELNPAEQLWGYLKMNPLANLAPQNTDELATITHDQARKVRAITSCSVPSSFEPLFLYASRET